MPSWLKKVLVSIITICTFGTVAPPPSLLDNAKPDKSTKANVEQAANAVSLKNIDKSLDEKSEIDERTPSSFITFAVEEAERQAKEKFGSKIGPVIETKFDGIILPKVKDTIIAFTEQQPLYILPYLTVSKHPKGGENEKIFNIYDMRTNEDLLRFHVRREHPPKDGFYFNFHYHSKEDNFIAHHELGKLYWGKNQPPQWLS